MSKATIARIDEKQIHTTPRGMPIWPKLIVPETKFDPAGVYELRMKFSAADEAAFLAEMNAIYDAAYEQTLREQARKELPRELPPWKVGKDGRTEFKFKLKASGVFDGKTWSNKPPKLFDAKRRLIENPNPDHFRFGLGSEVRTFFQVRPYYVQKAGITLRLRAVQILKFVPYDDANYFGIEEDDSTDAFVYEAAKPAAISEADDRMHAPIDNQLDLGCPLECHETGRPYLELQGDIDHIPIISAREREILLTVQ